MIGFIANLLLGKTDPLLRALDKSKFEKWLKSKPKNKIVGRSCLVYGCPIAQYLKDSGFNVALVSQSEVHAANKKDSYQLVDSNLPKWVTDFVRKIDDSMSTDNYIHENITAQQALEVLQKL